MRHAPRFATASRPSHFALMLLASGLLLALAVSAVAQSAPENRELPRFSQVSERLYRGAQPREGGLRRLAELGVNTIINLRGTDDRTRSDEAEARALGLNYFNLSLPRWGRPDDAVVQRVFEIIDAPENGRVFVHCRDGVDRTGTVTAIYRITREGWTLRDALAEAKRRGMRRIQFWMRDYVEDYGPLRGQGADGAAQHQINEEDLSDHMGSGVRIVESKAFRARKAGMRALRKVPGAVSGFLDGIF
jgi:protein tyrosine phosphatase (PTP) superfamily phosphohydrolase (DUF442 family)